ncbi:MAG: HAD family hydrolase [Candidatus Thorarchaeota archaeon]
MFEAVAFDADETIFNNQGIHQCVTRLILEDLKMPLNDVDAVHAKWDAYYFQEQSRLMEEVGFCIDRENAAYSLILALKDFNKEISFNKALEYYSFMVDTYSSKSKPYPDAIRLISKLVEKGIKMAIVSNGDTETIVNRLEVANITNHFEFILAPCQNLPLTKPDEKIFFETLSRLNTSPEKTIFVGDNPIADIEGANKVAMYSVLIDRKEIYSNLVGLQMPKLRIKSLDEMMYLFD